MKAILVGAVIVVAACAPAKKLPDFRPAPEGMTKAFTPYDIPMAVPSSFSANIDGDFCPQKRYKVYEPYIVGCEWTRQKTGAIPGDFTNSVITLYAVEGETPKDLTAMSEQLLPFMFNEEGFTNIDKDIGGLTFYENEKYPYYSRIVNIEYTDTETNLDKDFHAVQYLAPIPATDTHGLVVHVLQLDVIPRGTDFAVNHDRPRDLLFSVLDEMDHIHQPELYIRTAGGE